MRFAMNFGRIKMPPPLQRFACLTKAWRSDRRGVQAEQPVGLGVAFLLYSRYGQDVGTGKISILLCTFVRWQVLGRFVLKQ